MTLDELIVSLGISEDIVSSAVNANGFTSDEDFDGAQSHLVRLYSDYIVAMKDAEEARKAFKYLDGEESVDKSKVFDQYRRYAMDVYNAWSNAKRDYDKANSGQGSYFTIRGRARRLDERTR